MFEHGFLPMINDLSFGHPPPTTTTDNDRECDRNAVSHYTTGSIGVLRGGPRGPWPPPLKLVKV